MVLRASLSTIEKVEMVRRLEAGEPVRGWRGRRGSLRSRFTTGGRRIWFLARRGSIASAGDQPGARPRLRRPPRTPSPRPRARLTNRPERKRG